VPGERIGAAPLGLKTAPAPATIDATTPE
jgi:hypothetical protein